MKVENIEVWDRVQMETGYTEQQILRSLEAYNMELKFGIRDSLACVKNQTT